LFKQKVQRVIELTGIKTFPQSQTGFEPLGQYRFDTASIAITKNDISLDSTSNLLHADHFPNAPFRPTLN
jgi:hypothetical protein